MPPISLNRRRFLGCSAAASLALSQGAVGRCRAGRRGRQAGAAGSDRHRQPGDGAPPRPARAARHGGRRRLRPRAETSDARAGDRREGPGPPTRGVRRPAQVLERPDIDAVVVAVPCDLHEAIGCERPRGRQASLRREAARPHASQVATGSRPRRRSDPSWSCTSASSGGRILGSVEGVELIRRGELGPLVEARATWTSSNGPLTGQGGWLGRRARSGDFMVEQGVHIWDVLHWLHGDVPGQRERLGPARALRPAGSRPRRHRPLLRRARMGGRLPGLASCRAGSPRPTTASPARRSGSWARTAASTLGTGSLSFRDRQRPRQTIHPGPQNDTRMALLAFLTSIRAEKPLPPPITLAEARAATLTGLLVRKAVDERRGVTIEEIRAEAGSAVRR